MAESDRAYYRRRAETETELARQAALPCAARAHRDLAQAYLNKLASGEPVSPGAS